MFYMAPKFRQKLKKCPFIQNKCFPFCLQIDKMFTMSNKVFKNLNWLGVNKMFEQSVNSIVFKFVNGSRPY